MSDESGGEAQRPRKKVVYKPGDSGPATGRTAAVSRSPANKRPAPRPARVQPREEPVDADLAWIKESLKATQYVGDVLTRRDQYLNKVMSLKRKFAQGPERDYAANVEMLIGRLRQFPMQAMLRDVLRDDSQLKKIRFL